MPKFEVELDGQRYEVEAPSMEAAYAAWQKRRQERGAGKVPPRDYAGVPERALKGLGDPLIGAVGTGLDAASFLGVPGAPARADEWDKFTAQRQQKLDERVDPKSRVMGVDPAQVAGSMASPLNLGAGIMAARSARPIAAGIAAGALGGATQPVTGENRGIDRAQNTLAGAGAGGALGAIGPAITPFPLNAARRQAVNTLRNEGIEPTAGQQSGRRALRYAESHLGEMPGAGGATEAANERVAGQFTSAVLQRAGIQADRATPDIINQAFADNSQRFNNIAGRSYVIADNQLRTDVNRVWREYTENTNPHDRRPFIQNTIRETADKVMSSQGSAPGELSGRQYQQIRARIAEYERGTSDVDYRRALTGLRVALDDAMDRSIQQINPGLLGEWRDTRNQFRNLLVISQASTGAGEAAASGIISPAKLRQAVVAQDRRDYARGRGDFADLARSGETVLTPLPQSGTAPRVAAGMIPAAIGATVAGGMGGDVSHSVGGAIAGSMLPGATGRVLMSDPMQAYLKNQAITNPAVRSGPAALAPGAGSALAQPPSPLNPE